MDEQKLAAVITELNKQPKTLWKRSVNGGYDIPVGDGMVNVYINHLKVYDDKKNLVIFIHDNVQELYRELDYFDAQQMEHNQNRVLDGVLAQLQHNKK